MSGRREQSYHPRRGKEHWELKVGTFVQGSRSESAFEGEVGITLDWGRGKPKNGKCVR